MTAVRQDAWSPDDDLILAEVTLRHIREGGTQLGAFEEVGERISRTPAACGFRWNSCVRKRYEEAIQLAKQQRQKRNYLKKQTAVASHVSAVAEQETDSLRSQEQSFGDDAIAIEGVIRYLKQWKSTYGELQRQISRLEKELRLREDELAGLREQNEKLSRDANHAQLDYQSVNDDYKMLIQIMDRARRLTVLNEDEELRPRFKMDANGNLERIE
ncbi:RsfA family transcriptional regulator [Paenibacillus pasadenensis]|uniref:RsfA family transcriptional regulator n=1 Tax=Paenibacillus pasadenensis TaxID=217090 RepID=UPI00203E2E28|nr:RsfA family transcriptional regulator [Paenibacillus pasadenensis]MCM3746330.1 RsfA family transcriptional regulator [Paenibacillus pasadenensis]